MANVADRQGTPERESILAHSSYGDCMIVYHTPFNTGYLPLNNSSNPGVIVSDREGCHAMLLCRSPGPEVDAVEEGRDVRVLRRAVAARCVVSMSVF